MTFQVESKRNSCRTCTDIPRVFILSFWKEGGVGSTQNYNVFSSQNAVSEPLLSPPPPPRASQTSSRPPTMCWPCVVKLSVPSTSAAWQQLGPISNRLQKPRCSSAPLHLELEIALVFPCIIKSRTGVDVGNCFFFLEKLFDTKQFFF